MKRPTLIHSPAEWAAYCSQRQNQGQAIGFVPTMGALHAGHAALLRRSGSDNTLSLMSIFVNPTQFNDPSDLTSYPRTLDADLQLAAECGVDAVFFPTREDLYPDGFRLQIEETELSRIMEGIHRPGHFTGVLTVVMKLLLLTRPQRAYFGQKDYQQLALITRMNQAMLLDQVFGTRIIGCPTVREHDGLALSSRNSRLSPAGRRRAASLPAVLGSAAHAESAAAELQRLGFEIDYITDSDALSPGSPRRFAAVYLEGVRLIDNIPRTEAAHAAE